MRRDPEMLPYRGIAALRRFTFGIMVIAVSLAATGSTLADDSPLSDNRATKSGKPLVFHSSNAVALDRDDQAAVAGLIDRSNTVAERSDQSGDQTGLLTQLRFTAEPSLADSRPRARIAAASQDGGPTPPIVPSDGPSPPNKSSAAD